MGSGKVDAYLGRPIVERFRVPQIVVIDRQGFIRAQSHPIDETNLEDETYLRSLISDLLSDGRSPAHTNKTTSVR